VCDEEEQGRRLTKTVRSLFTGSLSRRR